MVTETKLRLFLQDVRQIDIARAVGVHKSYINRVVNGRQKPSPRIKKAFEKFGINMEES